MKTTRILRKARYLRELAEKFELHGLYHNVQVTRLGKEALGGQMRREEDNWHGKNWSVV